jgi:putative transposase
LVDHDHPELSVSRQCALLGLPRSTLYYQPTPIRESTLGIMAKIDAHYLEAPCSGSRRMVGYLATDGIPISRDRVRNLMRRMGLRVGLIQSLIMGSVLAVATPLPAAP